MCVVTQPCCTEIMLTLALNLSRVMSCQAGAEFVFLHVPSHRVTCSGIPIRWDGGRDEEDEGEE